MILRAPPREPDAPREHWPMGVIIVAAIAIIVIGGGLLLLVPNPKGF